jgi:hypothetical protein
MALGNDSGGHAEYCCPHGSTHICISVYKYIGGIARKRTTAQCVVLFQQGIKPVLRCWSDFKQSLLELEVCLKNRACQCVLRKG